MSDISAPPSYRNWLASQEGNQPREAYECYLFTDGGIDGSFSRPWQIDCGPYKFINADPVYSYDGSLMPKILLRVEQYLFDEYHYLPMEETAFGYYHGGDINDEIAALVSLTLGIRAQAGGITRQFKSNFDPRGIPVPSGLLSSPVLTKKSTQEVIPTSIETRSLKDLQLLAKLPALTPPMAIALVRCARLYQEALWISVSNPDLSWLLLVSAIEVAAGFWRSADETAVTRFEAAHPTLADYLRSLNISDLMERVATTIAPTLGSTRKFIDFLLEFLPQPPTKRPPLQEQVSWEERDLKVSFSMIYKYRSHALHGGTPFPLPMCVPPVKPPGWDGHYEKPSGLAISSLGGCWRSADLPMLLHMFEHIARGALLKWWDSMISKPVS